MGRFPQQPARQLNTPTTPIFPTKPTTPTLTIFSIQRPVASHSDAKRKPTGHRTRRDWQPNALQRASRCGKNSFFTIRRKAAYRIAYSATYRIRFLFQQKTKC